jgi:hypothetical protein
MNSLTAVCRPCPGRCGRDVPGLLLACPACDADLPQAIRQALNASSPWEDVTIYLNARAAALAWFRADRKEQP